MAKKTVWVTSESIGRMVLVLTCGVVVKVTIVAPTAALSCAVDPTA